MGYQNERKRLQEGATENSKELNYNTVAKSVLVLNDLIKNNINRHSQIKTKGF